MVLKEIKSKYPNLYTHILKQKEKLGFHSLSEIEVDQLPLTKVYAWADSTLGNNFYGYLTQNKITAANEIAISKGYPNLFIPAIENTPNRKFQIGDLVIPIDNPPLIGNHHCHNFIPYKVYEIDGISNHSFSSIDYNCVAFKEDSILKYGGWIPEEIFRPATEIDIHNWKIISFILENYKKGDKVCPAHSSLEGMYIVLGDISIETLHIHLDSQGGIGTIMQYVPGTKNTWENPIESKFTYGNTIYNRVLYDYEYKEFAKKLEEEIPSNVEKATMQSSPINLNPQDGIKGDIQYIDGQVLEWEKPNIQLWENPNVSFIPEDDISRKVKFKKLKRKFKFN